MVTRFKRTTSTGDTDSPLSDSVRQSAQQIWLAGLGAFAKAQEEGGKVFDSLVREGQAIQSKTQAAAEEKISEATSRMASMATDFSSKASGQWGKLESIFEERVAKALTKLGVPLAKDVDALVARIGELDRKVAKLSAKSRSTAARRPAAGAVKPAGKRSAARKTS